MEQSANKFMDTLTRYESLELSIIAMSCSLNPVNTVVYC